MSDITKQHRDDFYQGFVAAMLWTTPNDDENDPNGDLLNFELAPATAASLRAHCDAWIDANAKLLAQYSEERSYDSGQGTVWHYAGHDFWLTSAGHGTGFWDRGLCGLGDALTAACEQFAHKHHAYIGDDGLIYVSGMEEPRQAVALTAQQRNDAMALIQRGADDARQAARLPDYTDAEAATGQTVRVAWEIDIELAPGETFDDAVRQAVDIAHDQFSRAKGANNGATRPVISVEGEEFDLEEYPDLGRGPHERY